MTTTLAGWIILLVALVCSNLPWITERRWFFFSPGPRGKSMWIRLAEWCVLFLLCGALALGLERKMTGGIFPQGWEFYAVGVCLFAVFALPGVIWQAELKRRLARRAT